MIKGVRKNDQIYVLIIRNIVCSILIDIDVEFFFWMFSHGYYEPNMTRIVSIEHKHERKMRDTT